MKTKRLCICLFAVFLINSMVAQEELGDGLLFPQFENGFVVFKKGSRTPAQLNYNMLQQIMLFLDKENNVMELADIPNILVIIIGERRFFPVSSKGNFYEEVTAGEGSFFIQHRAVMLSQGKAAAYGGYSQTSSVTSIGSIQGGSFESQGGTLGVMGVGRTDLKVDEKFKMRIECGFFMKSGNSYKRFNSAKSLGKFFKGQASKIEEYAKEQSIDFTKQEDIAKITEYAFSLMKN